MGDGPLAFIFKIAARPWFLGIYVVLVLESLRDFWEMYDPDYTIIPSIFLDLICMVIVYIIVPI